MKIYKVSERLIRSNAIRILFILFCFLVLLSVIYVNQIRLSASDERMIVEGNLKTSTFVKEHYKNSLLQSYQVLASTFINPIEVDENKASFSTMQSNGSQLSLIIGGMVYEQDAEGFVWRSDSKYVGYEVNLNKPKVLDIDNHVHFVIPLGGKNPDAVIYVIQDTTKVNAFSVSDEIASSLDTRLPTYVIYVVIISVFAVMFFVTFYEHKFILSEMRKMEGFVYETCEGGLITDSKNQLSIDFIIQRAEKYITKLINASYYDVHTKVKSLSALNKKLIELNEKDRRSPAALVHIRLTDANDLKTQYGNLTMQEHVEKAAAKLRFARTKFKDSENIGMNIYRVGDDELAVLVNTKDKSIVDSLLNYISDNFQERVSLGTVGIETVLNFTAGVSIFPSLEKDLVKLFSSAEMTLNKAIKEGVHKMYFNEIPQHALENLKLENADALIDKALDNNEFYLNYQPIVSSASGEVVGLEALLRCKNNLMEQMPIEEIISAAEKGDVINRVGKFVIRQACSYISNLKSEGIVNDSTFVSVNISTYQFTNESLESMVQNAIEETQIDPSTLRLEVKESIFRHQNRILRSSIENVRKIGVKVILDEFKLNVEEYKTYKEVGIDGIKLSKDVVHDTYTNGEAGQSLISAVSSIGKYLELDSGVGLTGIQDRMDLDRFNQLGIKEVQGFVICKPSNNDGIIDFLSSQKVT